MAVGSFDRCVFVGEEECLLRCVVVLTEEIDGLAPRAFLASVEFAEVENVALENVALENATVVETTIFHNAPVEALFAILEAFRAAEKHDG